MQRLKNWREMWKPIEGFDGYEVSNSGKIRSVSTGLVLSSQPYKGYLKIRLVQNGRRRSRLVHRLVAQAFIPNPENKPEVNHMDLDKSNCYDWNLEWATKQENMDHYFANSNHVWPKGENSALCTIKDDQVREIFRLREQGMSLDKIAKAIGCHLAHVSDILNGVVRGSLGLRKPKIDCRSKIPEAVVLEMFNLRAQGKTYKEIGEATGWHKGTVGDVLRGKRVNGPAAVLERLPVDGRSRNRKQQK